MELVDAVRRAKRTYIIGNGGSHANAMHICNDLIACGVKAYTMDPSTLTAFANDYGYEGLFARWLSVLGEKGEILIVLSGSGESANILRALNEADRIGMDTWAIVGQPGGRAAIWAHNASIGGANMQQAEQIQIQIGHEVRQWLTAREIAL